MLNSTKINKVDRKIHFLFTCDVVKNFNSLFYFPAIGYDSISLKARHAEMMVWMIDECNSTEMCMVLLNKPHGKIYKTGISFVQRRKLWDLSQRTQKNIF